MMKAARFAIVSLALAACGGKSATTTTTTPAATGSVFELGEMTVFQGKDAMVKIHADGTTELGGHKGAMEIKPGQTASTDSLPVVFQPGPTLKADGSMEFKGEKRVEVHADGTVQDLVHSAALPVTVTADKVTMTQGGQSMGLALAADGKISIFGGRDLKPEEAPRVEGADTPGKRRTVLALLGLMLMPGEKSSDESENVHGTAPAASVPAVVTPAPAPAH